MANDYIRREDAIDAAREGGKKLPTVAIRIMHDIKAIPAADVVQVVRCRDCAGCEYDTALDQYWCTHGRLIIGRHVMPDDFCSYGKRREEEE